MAFSDVVAVAALAAVMGPDGANLSVRTFRDNRKVSDDTDPATLAESDYDGYERAVMRWTSPAGSGDGSARSYADPAAWTKGSDAGRNQPVYSWALMLSVGGGLYSTLAVRMLPVPVSMDRRGKYLEIDLAVAAVLTSDVPAGLLIGVEAELVLRGRVLPPTVRARLKGLRHALTLVWSQDGRAEAAYEAGQDRPGTYHSTPDVVGASNEVLARLDQLLGRVRRGGRADAALQGEIVGILEPKL